MSVPKAPLQSAHCFSHTPRLPWLALPLPAHVVSTEPIYLLCHSLWGWQDVIKAVFSEKVVVLATYGDRSIRSPSVVVQLPSVIALKVRG